MTIASTATRLDVRPQTALIGAEIHGVDLSRPLEPDTVTQIREALLRWKVVFFRDQDITPEQQIAFGRAFGEVTPAHPINPPLPGYPEIYLIDGVERTRRPRNGARRPVRHTGWHTDITFVQNPALGSVLKAVQVPPYAGDTIWTNLVAVYEALSPALRGFIDGLTAVHEWPDNSKGAAVHPVVRVHPETGERGLFVNPGFTKYIRELEPAESEAVLDLLFYELSRPEFHVRFHWQPNSLAFWDNRATAHLAHVDLAHVDFERLHHRITLTGDVPEGPTGFRSEALVGGRFGSDGRS